MTLARFPDWQARLHRFFESRRKQPMKWGENDCALFAADAVLVETGVDIAADFRGKYECPFSATRAIDEHTDGGDIEDLAEVIVKKFDLPELDNVLQARRGDLTLGRTVLGSKISVVWDGYCYSPGRLILSKMRLESCVRAWRI